MQFLKECHRLLRPDGVLRIAVPDFGRYLLDYARDGHYIAQTMPGRPTQLLALAEIAYGYGHRSIWDHSTLILFLAEVGFDRISQCEFAQSSLETPPDSENRREQSLYVEARKPSIQDLTTPNCAPKGSRIV